MKINIINISEEGTTLSFTKEDHYYFDTLSGEKEHEFSHGRVEVKCSLKKIRETVMIEGEIETLVKAACCRCLEPTSLAVKNSFRYILMPANNRRLSEEMELCSEDLEFGSYEGDFIDLDPIIYEQIILPIPMKVLCKESCKGLCSYCGINLNMASCQCHIANAIGSLPR